MIYSGLKLSRIHGLPGQNSIGTNPSKWSIFNRRQQAKGKNSVELADQAELIPTLELLKQAVEAGELDAAIEAVSGQLRSAFKK